MLEIRLTPVVLRFAGGASGKAGGLSEPPASRQRVVKEGVMGYSAEISRRNPTCFVFLIDQSGSMSDEFGGVVGTQKASFVADALNRMLQNLAIRASKDEGIRDYFDISVIGYGAETGLALGGALAGKDIVHISELASNPLRVDRRMRKEPDGAGGLVPTEVIFPVWVEPKANGGTPMCYALGLAEDVLRRWVSQHPYSFPPTVMNLTDGESTDGDPTEGVRRLAALATSDGETIVMNLHASSKKLYPVTFPNTEDGLPDDFARLLFRLSSPLTPTMQDEASRLGYVLGPGARGFVFNSGLEDVVNFLDIGTRTPDLR